MLPSDAAAVEGAAVAHAEGPVQRQRRRVAGVDRAGRPARGAGRCRWPRRRRRGRAPRPGAGRRSSARAASPCRRPPSPARTAAASGSGSRPEKPAICIGMRRSVLRVKVLFRRRLRQILRDCGRLPQMKLSIGQAWPGSPGRPPSGRYSGPRRRCAAARRLEAPLNSARAFLYAASAMLPIRPMATAL